MANYVVVAIRAGEALGEVAALSKRAEFRLDRPSTFSFTVNHQHPSAEFITELETDVVLYRDNVKIGRFVIASTRDTLDADSQYVEVSAVDYKGRFEQRILYSDLTFTAEDDVDIAWDAVTAVQNETNGDMGVTRGVVPSGESLTGAFAAGLNLYDAINTVASIDDGFDWDVDAELRFNIYKPRGTVKDRTFDYGGVVAEVDRQFGVRDFANAVRVTGDDTLTAETEGSGSATLGRWDAQVGFTSVNNQTLLQGLAIDTLNQRSNLVTSFKIRLRDFDGARAWRGINDVWLGDQVRFVAKTKRFEVNAMQRVFEIDVSVSDDGAEDVFFLLQGPRPTFLERINAVTERLTELERE